MATYETMQTQQTQILEAPQAPVRDYNQLREDVAAHFAWLASDGYPEV